MVDKKSFPFYIDELEVWCKVSIYSWPKEKGDKEYPGCAAGASIDDVTIDKPLLPLPKAIADFVSPHISIEYEAGGVTFEITNEMTISILDFDPDAVLEYLKDKGMI